MSESRRFQEEALLRAVTREGGEACARAVVYGQGTGPETDADWVLGAMARLEAALDAASVRRVRMACQCGYAMEEKKALVRHLFDQARDLESFAEPPEARQAGLYVSEGAIFLSFPFCPCPLLATVDRLPGNTWCQCTLGYSKVLFEEVFGCAFELELMKSIKAGDECCLMKMIPQGPVWPKAGR